MAIDVGASASDRGSGIGKGSTIVGKENPANQTGLITYIAIYCPADAAGDVIQVASFSASGDDLTTRGYVSLADASPGLNEYHASAGDFIPFEIRTSDYIGIYVAGGEVDYDDASGSGVWGITGDYVPCSSQAFTPVANATLSLWATGYQLGQINIGDTWKDIQNIQINIGDDWKQLLLGFINIADDWKNILH